MRKTIHFLFAGIFILLPMAIFSIGTVVGNLKGQLGNQMFQIAATIAHAERNNANYYFPDLLENGEFGIPSNYKEVFFRIKNIYPPCEPSFTYYQKEFKFVPIPYESCMKIEGYFQSEKFFDEYKDEILPLFAPSKKIENYLHKNYPEIIFHPNSVAIHIRTYLKEDPEHKLYRLHGRSYVEKAVQYFSEDALFVVFSDNIEWCKEQLQGIRPNMIFIEGESYYHDFYLISFCKHQIISNSSFSWWAAYLNKNSDKIVISPKKWFEASFISDTEDLIPDSWITIDN